MMMEKVSHGFHILLRNDLGGDPAVVCWILEDYRAEKQNCGWAHAFMIMSYLEAPV